MFSGAGVSVIGLSADATANDVPAVPSEILRIFPQTGGHVVVIGHRWWGVRSGS